MGLKVSRCPRSNHGCCLRPEPSQAVRLGSCHPPAIKGKVRRKHFPGGSPSQLIWSQGRI